MPTTTATPHLRSRRLGRALALLAVTLTACGGSTPDNGNAPDDASSRSTAETVATRDERAVVDPALGPRSIALRGDVEVGADLTATISPDIAGSVESWGWHRCTNVPTCLTIPGAEGPEYTLTEDDAWLVIRVIAVVDGRAVETRSEPVVDNDPEPFRERVDTDPSTSAAFTRVVGPGSQDVVVEAGCAVSVVAGVATPTVEGSRVSAEVTRATPAERHAFSIGSEGGLLTIGIIGDCDEATVEVSGRA